jgi:hypothetical protein
MAQPSRTVPKIMDVLAPAGSTQSDELDSMLNSLVVLEAVMIPDPGAVKPGLALLVPAARKRSRTNSKGRSVGGTSPNIGMTRR